MISDSEIFRSLNFSESTLNVIQKISEWFRRIQTDSEIIGNYVFGFRLIQTPYNGFRQIKHWFRKIQKVSAMIQKTIFMRGVLDSRLRGLWGSASLRCVLEQDTLRRPSQGFWETGETGHLFQENKGQILRGTGEQRQNWETGNIRKQIFDFWETGEQANLFQGNKGTGTPPPPPPPPWEGLIKPSLVLFRPRKTCPYITERIVDGT